MTTCPLIFDRALLVRRRTRAAPSAKAHDFLLRRAVDDLSERLTAIKRQFSTAAVIGAHHGLLSRALKDRCAIPKIISTESCAPLLAACPAPRVLCDEEILPFADGSLDLAASALSLHWVNDLPGTLVQIRQALRPDGLFLAAVLGGETLHEMRTVLMQAEIEATGGAGPRVAPMADVRDFGALLQRAGFALPVTDADIVHVSYASAFDLMRELRMMGAGNVLAERPRRPLPRQVLLRAAELYAERFPAPGGRITATFEIIYLTGWAPHESQQKPLRPGSARMRLADALGVREYSAGDRAVPSKNVKNSR